MYNNSSSLSEYRSYVEIWMSSQGKSEQTPAVLLLAEFPDECVCVHYHNSDDGVPDGVVEPVPVHNGALVFRQSNSSVGNNLSSWWCTSCLVVWPV